MFGLINIPIFINKKMLELNFLPFTKITTERLLLRRPVAEDAAEFLFLRSDEEVMKYIDRPRAASIEDAKNFLEVMNKALESNESICWAVTFKNDPGKVIGYIGYWRIKKEHYRAEIGYALHPAFWKKGITKEAILAVIDYGFNKMNLHSIEGDINADNIASAAILESVGFIKEAHFKEDFFFDGTFRDTIIYSLLKK
jgi:ribosomal-protein-alanine N-acetyltransferase